MTTKTNIEAILNYCFNRFCPLIILAWLIWSHFSFSDWVPYVMSGLILFVDRFQYKVGYSVGYCERHGIDPKSYGE